MSHRIIIQSDVKTQASGLLESDISSVEYSFTFTPSHSLTEQQQNSRVALIRKKLEKLAAEVTAAPGTQTLET